MNSLRILVQPRDAFLESCDGIAANGSISFHMQLWSRRGDYWACTGMLDLTDSEWNLLSDVFQRHHIEIHHLRK